MQKFANPFQYKNEKEFTRSRITFIPTSTTINLVVETCVLCPSCPRDYLRRIYIYIATQTRIIVAIVLQNIAFSLSHKIISFTHKFLGKFCWAIFLDLPLNTQKFSLFSINSLTHKYFLFFDSNLEITLFINKYCTEE